jgi:hypothetical protein
MPVASIRMFCFHFPSSFCPTRKFGFFILFVYQRLMGILSVATKALGVRKEMLCCRLIWVQHPLDSLPVSADEREGGREDK